MAQHRHKRETNARRPKAIQVAGPIAIMATVSAVSLGVLTATPRADELLSASSSGATTVSSTVTRDDIVSRSESRLLSRQEDKSAARREAKQEKKATLKAIRHAEGRAVDVMITGETGWQVADFLRANYAALDIEYIIFSQHIWSVERAGEGWRSMSDRGSITANHYDHVHVTVY